MMAEPLSAGLIMICLLFFRDWMALESFEEILLLVWEMRGLLILVIISLLKRLMYSLLMVGVKSLFPKTRELSLL